MVTGRASHLEVYVNPKSHHVLLTAALDNLRWKVPFGFTKGFKKSASAFARGVKGIPSWPGFGGKEEFA
jgi:hypothetical protein